MLFGQSTINSTGLKCFSRREGGGCSLTFEAEHGTQQHSRPNRNMYKVVGPSHWEYFIISLLLTSVAHHYNVHGLNKIYIENIIIKLSHHKSSSCDLLSTPQVLVVIASRDGLFHRNALVPRHANVPVAPERRNITQPNRSSCLPHIPTFVQICW